MQKNPQSFFEILNKSQETKTVDILIYGAIPSMEPDSYKMKNTAERFVQDFKALEKDYDRINIHINSPGGSVFHGFPIFNAIASSKKDIHTYNDGLAASMGGLLLLAGKKVHSAKNSLLMIHSASGLAIGNAQAMRETAEMLEKYDGIIAQHFASKSGKSVTDIQSKYLNGKDHFLTAEEALSEGFLDMIEDYESEDAPPSNIADMAYEQVLNLYKEKDEKSESFFDKIVNKVRAALAPANQVSEDTHLGNAPTALVNVSTDHSTNPNQPQTNTMDFQNSLTLLAKDQVTAEDLAAIRAEITAFTGANEKFTAEEVNAKIDAAKTEISNELTQVKAEKTNLETEVSNLKTTVESYKASGVTPSNTAGTTPDPIPGEGAERVISETDMELLNLRKAAGFA